MAQVSYVNATCIYPNNPVPAVNDLNLEIADGEFMVLVGPSGSGKSTALRMLAGLEPVSGGTVEIGGKDVADKAPKDRTSPWCSRTTRCTPTCRSQRTWALP